MGRPLNAWKAKGIDIAAWPTRNGGISFTISKRFKEKESGEWKETKSFFGGDLKLLGELISQASTWESEQGGTHHEPMDNGPVKPEVQAVVRQLVNKNDEDIPF